MIETFSPFPYSPNSSAALCGADMTQTAMYEMADTTLVWSRGVSPAWLPRCPPAVNAVRTMIHQRLAPHPPPFVITAQACTDGIKHFCRYANKTLIADNPMLSATGRRHIRIFGRSKAEVRGDFYKAINTEILKAINRQNCTQSANQSINWFVYMAFRKLDRNKCRLVTKYDAVSELHRDYHW